MPRILLIDDEPLVREVLRRLLERHGYTVMEASDGRAGLALWRSTPGDLVITDIFMPDTDGIEVIMHFKRLWPQTKIIAMTGGGGDFKSTVVHAALKLGAQHMLVKPFTDLTLQAAISAVLNPEGTRDRSVELHHPTSSRETAVMMNERMMNDPLELLVVEDNEDDIVLIEEAFAEAKYMNVVSKVRDGEEALAYLRQEGPYAHMRRPGLVLLDINMPKKNGFEVLQAMKEDPRLHSMPVVMLTTSDREDDINRSYTDGACSYIRKPMRLDQFIHVVKNFEHYWTMVARVPSTNN